MPVLRIIDIETTGWSPPSEIIELGRIDAVEGPTGWELQHPQVKLYRAGNGITAETMAVHHITEAMVADMQVCSDALLAVDLHQGVQPDVFVAHNCSFERAFISDELTGGRPWICTLKCALRLWADAPGHSNQVLRYWLGLDLPEALAMPPHRALPDAYVTGNILLIMLARTTVEQLIEWSAEPKLLPRMPFGKHKNAAWVDIPTDYLSWLTRQADMDTDVLWCARRELAGR